MIEDSVKIKNVEKYITESMGEDFETHNYQHALRVLEKARNILKLYKGKKINILVIETASLVHDFVDHKFFKTEDEQETQKNKLIQLLKNNEYKEEDIHHILYIIDNMSYSTGKIPETEEGKIVQDADRLDALLAFSIVRPFTYSAKVNRKMYDDEVSALSHYIEKKLKIEKMLNTEEAKQIAKKKAKITYIWLAYLLDELPDDIYEKKKYEKELSQFYQEHKEIIPEDLIPEKYK